MPDRPGAPRSVSVIVPVLDAGDTLDAQLAALTRQSYSDQYEIVVADNGSRDASLDIARSWERRAPGVRLVDASARSGASYARNAGASASEGEYLAFCEADDEVDEGWLAALVGCASQADMIGGRLDTVALNDEVVRAWRNFTPAPDRLLVGLHFLPYVVGANCAIWRDALTAVGGWNEQYSVATDVELSWRVQLAGFRLAFAPDAVVRYRFRRSLRALSRQSYRFGQAWARLQRDFRHRGSPGIGLRKGLRAWAAIAYHAPDLVRSRSTRGQWLVRVAERAGRLTGSVRYRTLVL